jgi:hypothetical protein
LKTDPISAAEKDVDSLGYETIQALDSFDNEKVSKGRCFFSQSDLVEFDNYDEKTRIRLQYKRS